MTIPEIPGYRVEGLLGRGACGSVYLARHESGGLVVAKVLRPESVNAELLANRIRRLYRSELPKVAVPLVAHSLKEAPYILISHLFSDREPQEIGERFAPRTLQMNLDEFLGRSGSWMLVRRLAQVLAEFHRRRVAHGNLKPGNIFFDAAGELLLADYAQGLMPGIDALNYTDALLYAPPEQLRDPEGYLEGAGFGWDVHAFGVLAFRLLNGVFPRCEETFRVVAPPAGEARRNGVEADCERVAAKLEQTPVAGWQGAPPTPEEAEAREVIDRCLKLDPAERYADMGEVLRALESITEARLGREAQNEERERVLVLERRRNAWKMAAGVGVAASLAMGILVGISSSKPGRSVPAPVVVVPPAPAPPQVDEEALIVSQEAVEAARKEVDRAVRASESLRIRHAEMTEDLGSSYELTDRLLSWAVESESHDLPVLEGRIGRLKSLDRSLRELLEKGEEHPPLERQRWRIELGMAELAVAGRQPEMARQRFAEALADAPAGDPSADARITRTRVLICLLGASDPEAGVSESEIAEARAAVEKIDPETMQRERLMAGLDLAEARRLRWAGEDERSLELYRQSIESMTRLCESQPQLAALRAWRARSFAEAGRVADGSLMADAALLLRQQAAAELIELIGRDPTRQDHRADLAGALGALAEAALELGDTAGAERMAKQGAELLEEVASGTGATDVGLVRLATLKGVLAACQAEAGQAEIAMRLVDEGLRHVEEALEKNNGNHVARFRSALLHWQKAGLYGWRGESVRELQLGTLARNEIQALLDGGCAYPSKAQLQRSRAYLTSELGDAALIAGRDVEAVTYFRESMNAWSELAAGTEGMTEYEEGLDWAEERLRDLGSLSSLPPSSR